MADYNKQTVAQLRQLLKDRGIPSTGLTRKAQIVEKLEEADSADAGAQEAGDAPADAATEAQEPEGVKAQGAQEDPVPGAPEASDAPADAATDVQESEGAKDQSAQEDPVPGPPLGEAGGMLNYFV
jgi:hypothetical protein